MVNLVCFKAPAADAEKILKGLEKDFYKPGNPMASGDPLYKVKGDKALFYCPVLYPVKAVKHLVEPWVIKGFKSSFGKAGITIERVRSSKKLEAQYEKLQEEKKSD